MRPLLLLILTLIPLCSMGQSESYGEKPEWAGGYFKEMPNSYVEVVSAFGYDLKEAREKAASEVIRRRSLAAGTEAKVMITGDALTVSSNHNIIVKARIIDEYIHYTSDGYTVYLLVQTAKNPAYQYEPVAVSTEYPFTAKVFVPGMAQIHKGSVTKGTLFISGECVFVAGIVVGQLLAANYYSKSQMEKNNAQAYKTYITRTNSAVLVRNVSIAGAAAVYLWNVIDGVVAKGNKHVVIGSTALAVTPYADPYSAGVALNFTF